MTDFLPHNVQYLIGQFLFPNKHNITISKHMSKGILTNKDYKYCFVCLEISKCQTYDSVDVCNECVVTDICIICDKLLSIDKIYFPYQPECDRCQYLMSLDDRYIFEENEIYFYN